MLSSGSRPLRVGVRGLHAQQVCAAPRDSDATVADPSRLRANDPRQRSGRVSGHFLDTGSNLKCFQARNPQIPSLNL